ncbi:hypothetical protein F8388_023186 [Cannabis sativa]|uniref:Uncharacterized protein n=1 Tax=Cannabis sativa TaxID=3483 RepID=A0A7J6HDL9_CANSA|nr:hypothetical protein F8388_023186 [Cannabis sativa]KAF4396673.1 hypothetical protein G4B88_028987 [Cannabis sativa]
MHHSFPRSVGLDGGFRGTDRDINISKSLADSLGSPNDYSIRDTNMREEVNDGIDGDLLILESKRKRIAEDISKRKRKIRPAISFVGKDMRTSLCLQRDVRMDKNIITEHVAEKSDIASNATKIVNNLLCKSMGLPALMRPSSLSRLPPGTINAIPNIMVMMKEPTKLQAVAVSFIHFSPALFNSLCSLFQKHQVGLVEQLPPMPYLPLPSSCASPVSLPCVCTYNLESPTLLNYTIRDRKITCISTVRSNDMFVVDSFGVLTNELLRFGSFEDLNKALSKVLAKFNALNSVLGNLSFSELSIKVLDNIDFTRKILSLEVLDKVVDLETCNKHRATLNNSGFNVMIKVVGLEVLGKIFGKSLGNCDVLCKGLGLEFSLWEVLVTQLIIEILFVFGKFMGVEVHEVLGKIPRSFNVLGKVMGIFDLVGMAYLSLVSMGKALCSFKVLCNFMGKVLCSFKVLVKVLCNFISKVLCSFKVHGKVLCSFKVLSKVLCNFNVLDKVLCSLKVLGKVLCNFSLKLRDFGQGFVHLQGSGKGFLHLQGSGQGFVRLQRPGQGFVQLQRPGQGFVQLDPRPEHVNALHDMVMGNFNVLSKQILCMQVLDERQVTDNVNAWKKLVISDRRSMIPYNGLWVDTTSQNIIIVYVPSYMSVSEELRLHNASEMSVENLMDSLSNSQLWMMVEQMQCNL